MIRLKMLHKSFGYAFEGLHYAWSGDQNLRVHFIVALIVLIAAFYFRISAFETSLVVVMIVLVITTEMINTAIEKMTDLITREHRQEAKIAKDIASAMVLVAAFGATIVGIIIFVPYIVRYFF